MIMAEIDTTSTNSTSSSIPSTTNSSAPLLKLKMTQRKKKNEVLYYLRIAVWITALAVLATVLFYAVMGVIRMHQEIESVTCYECISFHGKKNKEEPGLPVEKKCYEAPRNARVCNPGSVCSMVLIQTTTTTRVHRACIKGDKVGCLIETSPANTTSCFCNTSYCLMSNKFKW